MQIWSLPDVQFPRHEWHFIKKPSRGHCEASFIDLSKKTGHAQLNTMNFRHDIQVLQLGAF